MTTSLFVLLCLAASAADFDPNGCVLAPGLDADACAQVPGLLLPETLPPARGSIVGDSLPAAYLGYAIYFDARFSGASDMRCASCHTPEDHFGDGQALPTARGLIGRNAPGLLNAAWGRWQFWDGRADTLWSQPLFAFENPNEMNLTRLELVQQVAAHERQGYENVFGPLPEVDNLPPVGKPGDAAFDTLAPDVQHAVNTVAANVGKAIEAYLRQVAAGRSPFDAHLLGDANSLTDTAKHGIAVFIQAGCIDCHGGPTFSDDGFHNIGVPAVDGAPRDTGRADGVVAWSLDTFNENGPYYEGTPGGLTPSTGLGDSPMGAFKTPSVRNLAVSAPYGHNGMFATLEDVVDFHLRGGGGTLPGTLGRVDPKLAPRVLTNDDRAALLEFLRSLNGSYRGDPGTPPNWWSWPDR